LAKPVDISKNQSLVFGVLSRAGRPLSAYQILDELHAERHSLTDANLPRTRPVTQGRFRAQAGKHERIRRLPASHRPFPRIPPAMTMNRPASQFASAAAR
jgi:hypothetical protein